MAGCIFSFCSLASGWSASKTNIYRIRFMQSKKALFLRTCFD